MSTCFPRVDRRPNRLLWLPFLLLGGCAMAGVANEDAKLRPDQGDVLVIDGSVRLDGGALDAKGDPETAAAEGHGRVPPPDASTSSGEPDIPTQVDAGPIADGGKDGDGQPRDAGEDAAAPVDMADTSTDAGVSDPDSEADATVVIDAGPPTEGPKDLGEGDGSDVVTIGDSWMRTVVLGAGGGVEGALDRAGTRYRHYGEALVSLLEDTVYGNAIPRQWDRAVANDPDIKTVIMTGGGGDVYEDGSCGSQEGCPELLAAMAQRLGELWADMAAAGVRDVVYVAYSADVGSGVTADVEGNGIAKACRAAPLRCHVLETTEIVHGELTPDGLVPMAGAGDRIATAVGALLLDSGARR